MRASPLWAGERFRNVHPVIPGLRDPTVPMPTIADFLCGGERRYPAGPLPSVSPRRSLAQAAGERAARHLAWPLDGADRDRRPARDPDPVWGKRASPSSLVGPKRFQPALVALREMPPVDLVVISHDHYDHLDYPTIRELARTDVPFVTSLGVGAHLEDSGLATDTQVDW